MSDHATRHALRYVKLPDDGVVEPFPDFLIAGPQRTGTTWLHAHLRHHPEIMLAEPKELFFFSSLKDPGGRRFRSNELRWYQQFFREPVHRVLLRHLMCLRRYGELYRPKVKGEATASYAALDRDVIEEIVALKPGIKAILMLRNPVDRAWSHAKKDLSRNRQRPLQEVSPAEFERFFTDPYQLRCARYCENIDNWSACLQPGNLFVGRFDDIARQPDHLLLDVMTFLGVKSDRRYVSPGVRQRVNPTGASRVPERHRRFLTGLFQDELSRLEERFGLAWPTESSTEPAVAPHRHSGPSPP